MKADAVGQAMGDLDRVDAPGHEERLRAAVLGPRGFAAGQGDSGKQYVGDGRRTVTVALGRSFRSYDL
ncbi:hypothetical protein GCM10010486_87200 [Nonomuraea roseoviolacea subsp. carminata]